jgi:hypothetical protein
MRRLKKNCFWAMTNGARAGACSSKNPFTGLSGQVSDNPTCRDLAAWSDDKFRVAGDPANMYQSREIAPVVVAPMR